MGCYKFTLAETTTLANTKPRKLHLRISHFAFSRPLLWVTSPGEKSGEKMKTRSTGNKLCINLAMYKTEGNIAKYNAPSLPIKKLTSHVLPVLTSALQPFCSSSLCHNAAILVTPASVRGLGQSDAECLE